MTPQAEFGPDVFHPTEDDHDPDRVVRDAERNAKIARGAALAQRTNYGRVLGNGGGWQWTVERAIDSRLNVFYGATLADALIALAMAVDAHNEPTTE
jgi:hypothetical protein